MRTRCLIIISFLSFSWLGASAQSGPEGDHHPGYSSKLTGDATAMQVNFTVGNTPKNADYVPGFLDNKVWQLESQIEAVRDMWLHVDRNNTHATADVRDTALRYTQSLVRIPNTGLGLGGLIVKNEYVCFGFVIAAANDKSQQDKLLHARAAQNYCERALFHLKRSLTLVPIDENARAVSAWASASSEQPRISYLAAMSECLLSTASGDPQLKKQSLDVIQNEIPAYYIDRYPPSRDYVLSQCLTH